MSPFPLKDPGHFVPLDAIARIAVETPLRDVFEELSRRRVGAFVVTEDGRPRQYLTGRALAELVGATGWQGVANIPLARFTGPDVMIEGIFPVSPEPVDAAADPGPLQNRADTVFVVYEGGAVTGWFLNHELLRSTVNTPPPVWECKNGHINTDPDNGTCHRCPFPLKLKTS